MKIGKFDCGGRIKGIVNGKKSFYLKVSYGGNGEADF